MVVWGGRRGCLIASLLISLVVTLILIFVFGLRAGCIFIAC